MKKGPVRKSLNCFSKTIKLFSFAHFRTEKVATKNMRAKKNTTKKRNIIENSSDIFCFFHITSLSRKSIFSQNLIFILKAIFHRHNFDTIYDLCSSSPLPVLHISCCMCIIIFVTIRLKASDRITAANFTFSTGSTHHMTGPLSRRLLCF